MKLNRLAIAVIAAGVGSLANAETPLQLDPIIVYGEKIARDLQDTTSSVRVVASEEIERTQPTDVRDTFRRTANVRKADWLDAGILIRGINSEGVAGPSGRPYSTVYVDGVAQTQNSARRGPTGLWDVEAVEIFRGAQSSVSGRNSLAGNVQIRSKDPVFDTEGSVKLSVGSRALSEQALMYNTAINDEFAVRFSVERATQDGHIDHQITGTTLPLPYLDTRSNTEYENARVKVLHAPTGENAPRTVVSFNTSYNSPDYEDVKATTEAGLFDGVWESPYYGTRNWDEARETRVKQLAVDSTIPLSKTLTADLTVTKLNSLTDVFSYDGVFTNYEQSEDETTLEGVLNFTGAGRTAFVGAYYADTREKQKGQRYGGQRDLLTELENRAVFGELEQQVSASTTAIVGLRFDQEKIQDKKTGKEADYSALLPKLGLRYDLNPSTVLGASYKRGYRAGGFGSYTIGSTTTDYDYNPEFSNTFEISARTVSLNGVLSLNTNLFLTQLDDQQVEVQVGMDGSTPVFATRTAAKGEVKGAEVEATALVTDNLETFIALGITQTEFEDFSTGGNDFSGLPFPQSPDQNLTIGFDADFGKFKFGASAQYTAGTVSRDYYDESVSTDSRSDYETDSFTVVDAQASYDITENLTARLNVENLLDEEYLTYRNTVSWPGAYGTLGKPRSAKLSVQYDF